MSSRAEKGGGDPLAIARMLADVEDRAGKLVDNRREVIALGECEVCGAPIPIRRGGPGRKTCGAACRQRLSRQRRRAEGDAAGG